MNAHKREEYKRKLTEKYQKIAELEAHIKRLEGENLAIDINSIYSPENIINIPTSQSLKEHDRQVILDAVDSVQKKTSATVVLSMVREYANSLTNGDDNG